MGENQSKNFVSVGLISFPSRVQYDLWYEKYITFYSPKAVEFLKENGQLSQSASLIEEDNDLMRVSIIWVYRDKRVSRFPPPRPKSKIFSIHTGEVFQCFGRKAARRSST